MYGLENTESTEEEFDEWMKKNYGGINMSEERCVMCGDIIQEGRMVCPICEKNGKEHLLKFLNPLQIKL